MLLPICLGLLLGNRTLFKEMAQWAEEHGVKLFDGKEAAIWEAMVKGEGVDEAISSIAKIPEGVIPAHALLEELKADALNRRNRSLVERSRAMQAMSNPNEFMEWLRSELERFKMPPKETE